MTDIRPIIGIAAGICTAVAALPQIFRTFRTKDVRQVSPFMFIILLAGNLLWCYYGILLEDWPIILTNGFSTVMDIIMLTLKGVYGKRSHNE